MKEKNKKSVLSIVINVVFSIIFFAWIAMLLYDYVNVSKAHNPKFCLSHVIKDYTDGSVEICNGLGYKVYKYDRLSYKAIEFGPFWMKEKGT